MTPDAVAVRATAAVLVDGGRTGSAVLVDGRHLVTAAHVLPHVGAAQTESADRVELVFPGITLSGATRCECLLRGSQRSRVGRPWTRRCWIWAGSPPPGCQHRCRCPRRDDCHAG